MTRTGTILVALVLACASQAPAQLQVQQERVAVADVRNLCAGLGPNFYPACMPWQRPNGRAWCCRNDLVLAGSCAEARPRCATPSAYQGALIPGHNQPSGPPVFVPGQNLGETAVGCRDQIIGALLGGPQGVAELGGAPYALYQCLTNSPTTADRVNNCLAAYCNAVGNQVPGCNVNTAIGLIAYCSQFAAHAVANFLIPNTMQALNNGLFQRCIGQASCRACKRCCGANGDAGGTNDTYYRCSRSCAALPGGLFSVSVRARRTCGLPVDYNPRSQDTRCLEDFAGWDAARCGR